MCSDEKLDRTVREARSWQKARYDAELSNSAYKNDRSIVPRAFAFDAGIRQPFSGNERNKVFFNNRAKQFVDLSAISAMDNPIDGRVFVVWDFDRDGWPDIAVVNANAPLLNIYHNEIGPRDVSTPPPGHSIAIRFVGGNHSSRPSKGFTCRDGYGAKVRLTAGDLKLIREHRCGEGFAGQNSATMIIGIGHHEVAQSLVVDWPSGVKQRVGDVRAGTLLTVFENPAQSPNGTVATRESYTAPSQNRWDEVSSTDTRTLRFEGVAPDPKTVAGDEPMVLLYTTMATHCLACKRHLPQLHQLQSKLGPESVQMYGIPIDEADDREKLLGYAKQYQPAYQLLLDLAGVDREQVKQLLSDSLTSNALPSTIVTDTAGEVLLVTAGLPTVSQVRQLLARRSPTP